MEQWQGGEFPDLENKLEAHKQKVHPHSGKPWQGIGSSVGSASRLNRYGNRRNRRGNFMCRDGGR